MNSALLLRRRPRKQTGQRIETATAWFLRFYENGQRVCKKLADKDSQYRTWDDVKPLILAELARVHGESTVPSGAVTVGHFIEQRYLPYCDTRWAPATANDYRTLWARWKPYVSSVMLPNLKTENVTAILTAWAKQGLRSRTLSHRKWFLSGAYEWARAQGVVRENPVPAAAWQAKVARNRKQKEYSLAEVKSMLAILEPLDIRAAVALALAYFAALRPAEIRGLTWDDYNGVELFVRRSVWRGKVGETKTEGSEGSVPVIEPLRGLLEKLRTLYGGQGYILQNANHHPLSLNSLNTRVIAPAMKKAGIDWRGYYPGRRGISSLVTDTSKNALNSTGLLRHSTPITALKHYTRAQKESIKIALEQVEQMATKKETVQ